MIVRIGRALTLLAALVVVPALALRGLFLHDMDGARARLAGQSETIETAFGREEFAVAGQGEPILVIHGSAGGFDQGLEMSALFANSLYQRIAPSRFGYLGSVARVPLSTAMQADAYVPVLDRLGVDQVDVVGISAGAWSALDFAIRHPERCRALVLVVPADFLPEGVSVHGGRITKAMIGSDFVAWAAGRLMPLMPGTVGSVMLGTDERVIEGASREEKARLTALMQHLSPISARHTGMQFDIETAATRHPEALASITCPVLTISTDDDQFGTGRRAREIANAVGTGHAIVYPTGGHALVGRQEVLRRDVEAFLGSHHVAAQRR